MERYKIISLKDGKVLKESDSYSFIIWASNRYKRLEVDFKIIDGYTGETKEEFKSVII